MTPHWRSFGPKVQKGEQVQLGRVHMTSLGVQEGMGVRAVDIPYCFLCSITRLMASFLALIFSSSCLISAFLARVLSSATLKSQKVRLTSTTQEKLGPGPIPVVKIGGCVPKALSVQEAESGRRILLLQGTGWLHVLKAKEKVAKGEGTFLCAIRNFCSTSNCWALVWSDSWYSKLQSSLILSRAFPPAVLFRTGVLNNKM